LLCRRHWSECCIGSSYDICNMHLIALMLRKVQ
jgi:hypothetical protein